MGLNTDMFFDSNNIFDLKCVICLGILEGPSKMSNCTHHFCYRCISEWMDDNDTCPSCITRGDIEAPDDDILEKLRKLPAKCYHHAAGCQERIPLEDLTDHVHGCQYRMVLCPQRCGVMLPVLELPRHMIVCLAGVDPLVESFMCYNCRTLYRLGSRPSHCNYYDLARSLWQNQSRCGFR